MKSLRELMNLSGRAAVVTGGAGYLGRALCEALAELGAEVCVLDVAADQAKGFAQSLRERFGVRATAVTTDITSEPEVERAVAEILAAHGRLDILVNNAAYAPNDLPPDGLALARQTLAQWKAQTAVMLEGTFLMTRACAPHLAAHQCGSIISIASIYGLTGPIPSLYEGTDMTNPAYYAAAKGGIIQLTRYWATMLAPSIRANCIAPGGIWRNQPESFHARYQQHTPLGRMATEEDFKGAAAFLASDLSAYVTGQILAVDGGWTAW
jgi:NAD(P)-dependent dehydrogenase (short-subunit alcohol dehydrogenase family)